MLDDLRTTGAHTVLLLLTIDPQRRIEETHDRAAISGRRTSIRHIRPIVTMGMTAE
jgi:hypothetical protein